MIVKETTKINHMNHSAHDTQKRLYSTGDLAINLYDISLTLFFFCWRGPYVATLSDFHYTYGKTDPSHMETPDIINLLFVDSDTRYMAIAQHHLSRFQGKRFNVVWKQDGAAAIEELKSNPSLHLAIIDYYLPEANGLEVTKAIREQNIDIPIIFLTSNKDFKLAIEVMRFGVEDYMIKDEAVESVLPRTIVNILERVYLKRRIAMQQKAELIAKKRTDAIKELVVTVCHEFNNPLAAIKISTDILLRQPLAPHEKKLVEALDNNIALVEKEITKLRDINFEKMDFGKG